MGDVEPQAGNSNVEWGGRIERAFSKPTIACAVAILALSVLQSLKYEHPDHDAAYHLAVAKAYSVNGWLSGFRWMHSTWLADHFVDPYCLLHWLVAPILIVVPDHLQALRFIEVTVATGTVLALGMTLKQLNVRASYGWALTIIAASPLALIRIGALHGTALFTIVWLYFILVVSQQRARLAFGLSWLAVYLYTGFLLLPASAVCFAVASVLVHQRLTWRTSVASLLGVGAGLLVNPFWPHHFRFYREELIDSFSKSGLEPGVSLAAEWMSVPSIEFLRLAALPVVLAVFAMLSCALKGRALSVQAIFTWILSGALFVLSAHSIKFLDYVGFAVCIAFALSWSTVRPTTRHGRWLMLSALVVVGGANLDAARINLASHRQTQPPISRYRELGEVLRLETTETEPVVVPWDDFPFIMLYNLENTYPVGLNPNYLRRTDEKRFAALIYLYSGRFSDPDQAISTFFDSKWLVVRSLPRNTGEQQLLAMLREYPRMRQVHANESFTLFRRAELAPSAAGSQPSSHNSVGAPHRMQMAPPR